MMKKMMLYRFDYELNEGTWIAHIAAYSQEKALKFLQKRVKGHIRVFSTGAPKRIDAIHDDIIIDILELNKPEKKGRGRPKGSFTKDVKKDQKDVKKDQKDVKKDQKDETKNVIL